MSETGSALPAKEKSAAGGRPWIPISISLLALAVSAFGTLWQFTSHRRATASEIHDLKNQIEEHFQRGELEEARRDIREASIKAPRNYEVWVLDGRHRAQTGDHEEAERLFLRALHKEADYAPAHFHLARLLREKGEFERARRHLEEALSIAQKGGSDVGRAILLVNLGDVLYAERNLEDAKNIYREALQADPVNPDAHARLAEIYMEELRYEDAIEEYGHALRSDQENAEHLRGAALVFYYADDYVRAEDLVRRSLKIRESQEALELLALVLEDQGKDSEDIRARLEGLRSGSLWLEETKAPQVEAGGENGQEIAQ